MLADRRGDDPPWDTDVPESEVFDGERPGWGPDGTTVLFSRTMPNGSQRLYLLDVETLEVEPVLPASSSEK